MNYRFDPCHNFYFAPEAGNVSDRFHRVVPDTRRLRSGLLFDFSRLTFFETVNTTMIFMEHTHATTFLVRERNIDNMGDR